MTTLSPQITATGISGPSYPDIYAQLQSIYWQIYGSDSLLTPDTQDGQLLGAFAQAIYDSGQACIATYQQFSPTTAKGAGLSSIVAINNLQRINGTASTAVLTITGTAGTVITGGLVGDNQSLNTQWALPASVTIPVGGSITVTATCTTLGANAAAPSTLENILTPTSGWTSVTNLSAATTGVAVETDVQLLTRQQASPAAASKTQMSAIRAAVAAVPGATPSYIYQNNTESTDSHGLPPHSMAAVVSGGTPSALATAIAQSKSPGLTTVGTSNAIYTDTDGTPDQINWYVLTLQSISVTVTLTTFTGYVSSTDTLIKQAIAAWINSLGIGANVYLNKLFAPANLSGDIILQGINAASNSSYTQAQLDVFASTYTVSSITQAITGNTQTAADIGILFNQMAYCSTANITVVP